MSGEGGTGEQAASGTQFIGFTIVASWFALLRKLARKIGGDPLGTAEDLLEFPG